VSPTVIAFLHFLYWASHYLWLAFAPDNTGNGNHVVYGGNILDCWQVAHQIGWVNAPGGHIAATCIQSAP
jgi:hypothetical protein